MSNEQEHIEEQQEQRQVDHDLLGSERKARGDVRNAHLETGRERARSDNALARKRTSSTPPPMEDTGDDDYEAQRTARKEAERATMKAEARSRYDGSDEAFEQDWPQMRERLIMENLEKDLKLMRRGL